MADASKTWPVLRNNSLLPTTTANSSRQGDPEHVIRINCGKPQTRVLPAYLRMPCCSHPAELFLWRKSKTRVALFEW